jgi:hypothetical protein
MYMKRCPRCGEDLSLSSFGKSSQKKDGLNVYCILCMRKYRIEHYQNNKKAYRDRAIEQVKACRLYVQDLKRTGSCTDCGVKYPEEPWLFDFDHLDGDTKTATISKIVKNGSLKLLKEEIEKCELVCVICHRRRTALRAGWTCDTIADEVVF